MSEVKVQQEDLMVEVVTGEDTTVETGVLTTVIDEQQQHHLEARVTKVEVEDVEEIHEIGEGMEGVEDCKVNIQELDSVVDLGKDNCGFTFKMNSLGDKIYFCRHCDYKSEFIASLRDHLNAWHFKKPLNCTECTYQTYRFKNLNSHRHVKHQLNAMKCDQPKCTFKTILEEVLIEHYKKKHNITREFSKKPKDVWSSSCGLSDPDLRKTRSSLKGIKKPHRYRLEKSKRVYNTTRVEKGGGKYSYSYSCVWCGFQSSLVAVIKAHANKQHLGKQVSCTECSFETYYPANLQVHMRKVHGKKAENCLVPNCKFRTLFSSKMQIHLFTKHHAAYDEAAHSLMVPIY